MHSAKGGRRGQKGEGSSFASCSMVSVSMVSHVLAGKGSESKNPEGRWHSEMQRPLGPPVVAGRPDGPAKPVWYRILHSSRAVLTQSNSGAPKAPVFSGKKYSSFPEFRILSSSGNHASSLVLTLKFIFCQLQKPPPPRSCLNFCSSFLIVYK